MVMFSDAAGVDLQSSCFGDPGSRGNEAAAARSLDPNGVAGIERHASIVRQPAPSAPPIDPIATRLGELSETVIGLTTQAVAQSQEVTILADRTVPFTVIKRVMSTCTSRGYAQISLAVLQKAPETVLSQN